MGEECHDAHVIQSRDEVPEFAHVSRHVCRPPFMTMRQHLRRRHVFDSIGMPAKRYTAGADFERVGIDAAIECLCGKSVGDGDQGDIRLLTKCEAKAKRPVRRQVARQKIGKRLTRITLRLFLRRKVGYGVALPVMRIVFDDFPICGNADTIDDASCTPLFRFRVFILRADKAALKSDRSIVVQRDEDAAPADVAGIITFAQGIDPLDLGFKLGKTFIHIGRQVVVRVLPFRCQVIEFLPRGRLGRFVFFGKLYRLRIDTPHPMGVREINEGLRPFPAFRPPQVSGDAVQLGDDKLIQKRGIIKKSAAILSKQVTDDSAARFGIGLRTDKYGLAVVRLHMCACQVAADRPRLTVIAKPGIDLFLPRVIVGDGKGHQLIQRQIAIAIDLHQLGADGAETHPLLHHMRRYTEAGSDFLGSPSPMFGKLAKGLELVCRVQPLGYASSVLLAGRY